MKTNKQPPQNRKAIKLVRNFEDQDGKSRSRFDTVGYLQGASDTGKIEFYIDIPLLGQKLVVFRGDETETNDAA